MVSLLTSAVDDALASLLPSPAPGLADSALLEHELAADRHAAFASAGADPFDPEGFYRVEQERDDALDFLADNFPPAARLSLSVTRRAARHAGRWLTATDWNAALIDPAFPDGALFVGAASPLAAAELLVDAWRKAQAPADAAPASLALPAADDAAPVVTVRERPECRPVSEPSADALGRIDPATAADLFERVERGHGRSDFLTVDTAGRVFLTSRVGPEEARALGVHVARHVAAAAGETAVRVVVEPAGDLARPVLIVGNGKRVALPTCATAADALAYGTERAWEFRPTVAPDAAAASVAA